MVFKNFTLQTSSPLSIFAPAFTRHSAVAVRPLKEARISAVRLYYYDITQRVTHTSKFPKMILKSRNIKTKPQQTAYLIDPLDIRPRFHQAVDSGRVVTQRCNH